MLARSPEPGDTIGGRYRIVRALGDGGMGAVFEAENTFTHKRVAIKWLLPSLGGRKVAHERLLREAQAGSRVKHRNVIDIYDIGFEQDAMFLVMELLEGQTLGSFLAHQSVSIPAFLRLLLPALRGVAEAHRQGVIHRDIKPDNIFLAREVDQPQPVAMVLDFGVAKLTDAQLLTRTGDAVGTPLFMAPEQLRGARDLDARVDVYAFGVILYMALTGRAPHQAITLPELAFKVSSYDAEPPLALRPELPRALSDAVARAAAREREQRTASMQQLIEDLSAFADDSGYLSHAAALADTRRTPAPQLDPELSMETSSLHVRDSEVGVTGAPLSKTHFHAAPERAPTSRASAPTSSPPAVSALPSQQRSTPAPRRIALGAAIGLALGGLLVLGVRERTARPPAAPNAAKAPVQHTEQTAKAARAPSSTAGGAATVDPHASDLHAREEPPRAASARPTLQPSAPPSALTPAAREAAQRAAYAGDAGAQTAAYAGNAGAQTAAYVGDAGTQALARAKLARARGARQDAGVTARPSSGMLQPPGAAAGSAPRPAPTSEPAAPAPALDPAPAVAPSPTETRRGLQVDEFFGK